MTPFRSRGDLHLLRIVEAAYRLEVPAADWLSGLTQAAEPCLASGFGLAAFRWHYTSDQQPEINGVHYHHIPEKLAAMYPETFRRIPAQWKLRPFAKGPCITASQSLNQKQEFRNNPHIKQFVQPFGVFDTLWITATDPGGFGCGFHVCLPDIAWASPAMIARWGRVASHLTAALRLRRRLNTGEGGRQDGGGDCEAVMTPDGAVAHAEAPAKSKRARDRLRAAVLAYEKMRSPLDGAEADLALERRRGLVDGRWSLVDRFEGDGRRYVVARENTPRPPGPDALSERERQVIAFARLGHSNKLIAYDLGISDSTVRVLLWRASGKLGIRNREDLLRSEALEAPAHSAGR